MKPPIIDGKIAVTVWEQRISPVFDSARTLLIGEIRDKVFVDSLYRPFDSNFPAELLRTLRTEKVRIIICGAISIEPAEMLVSSGFELIPFITGDVSTVLEAFIKGDTLGETFNMPGCGRNICCRGKIRRGHDISFTNTERGRGRRRQSPDLAAEQGDSNGNGGTTAITLQK